MRRASMTVAMSAVVVLAANTVEAASILDFDIWMRKIDKRIVDVQRHIAARDAAAATANARELEDLYRLTEEYFARSGKADDAVKMSAEGKNFAAAIAQSIEANDYDTAQASALRISKACNNCHDPYKPFK